MGLLLTFDKIEPTGYTHFMRTNVPSHPLFTCYTPSINKKENLEMSEMLKENSVHTQYGMRKIHKSEFDPRRYILRKGFPDFPACPYGHTFKMLGYDKETKEYVRLTASILKASNLEKTTYKGVV